MSVSRGHVSPARTLTRKILASTMAVATAAAFMVPMGAIPQKAEASGYAGGSGTEAAPYLISTADQLKQVSNDVNAGTGTDAWYQLTGNIELSSDWTPIGTASHPFKGHFNGAGYTISGVNITAASSQTSGNNVGFFGKVTGGPESDPAVIENFVLQGSITSSAPDVGGVVGYQGHAADSYATIKNVGSELNITATASTSSSHTGGIAGCVYSCTITGCYNKGSISSSAKGVGGIIGLGDSYNGSPQITSCYNLGQVQNTNTSSSAANFYAAGISGYKPSGYYSLPISNCYNAGTLKSNDSEGKNLAGIAGGVANFSNAKSYWLDGCGASQGYTGSSVGTGENVVKEAASVMTSDDFVTTLNADAADTWKSGKGLAQEYPALSWEKSKDVPVITAQPATGGHALVGATDVPALEVKAGLPTAAPASTGTLSYQWYANSADSVEGGTPIEGATSDSYTPPATTAGMTYYYVVVTNTYKDADVTKAATATSHTASFAVLAANPALPTFTAQPTAVEVGQADTTTLSAAATVSDGGTVEYQWYKCDDAAGTNPVKVEGATSATFNPDTMTLGDAYYLCAASNDVYGVKSAEVKSSVAKVTVKGLEISTPAQLKTVADNVNEGKQSYEGMTVTLAADIDLASDESTKTWTPIGTDSSHSFKGVFDGAGHRVKNLNVDGGTSSNQGLFGYTTDATLKNFIVAGTVSGGKYVGGAVGHCDGSAFKIENVGNEATVTSTGTGYNSGGYVGGIVGYGYGSKGIVSGCYNKGNVTGAYSGVGGIIGYGSSSLAVTSCYNTGSVTNNATSSYSTYVGGIVGQNGVVRDSYNTGTVTAAKSSSTSYQGAIIGSSASDSWAGEGNYYLEGTNSYGGNGGRTQQGTKNISKTRAEIEAADFVDMLNAGDYAGTWKSGSGINANPAVSPAFYWETDGTPGTVSYEVSIAKTEHGTITVDQPTPILEKSLVTVSAAPEEGYTLDRVTVTAEDGTQIACKDGRFIMPSQKVTVAATFKLESYTVTFDMNGKSLAAGTSKPADQTVERGSKATRPETDPQALQYPTASEFVGWSLNKNATVGDYDFTEPIMGNTTIYAIWKSSRMVCIGVKDPIDATVVLKDVTAGTEINPTYDVTPSTQHNLTYYADTTSTLQAVISKDGYVTKTIDIAPGTSNVNDTLMSPIVLTPAADEPAAVEGLVYQGDGADNGTFQTLVKGGTGYTIEDGSKLETGAYKVEDGDAKARWAGTYTVTVKLADGYAWSDGSTADRAVEVKIAPADLANATVEGISEGDELTYDSSDPYTYGASVPQVTVKLGDWTLDSTWGYKATVKDADGSTYSASAELSDGDYELVVEPADYSADLTGSKTVHFKVVSSNQKAANAVSEQLGKLPAAGDVTLDDEGAVSEAKAAYDALTDDQRALVSKDAKDRLDAAVAQVAKLKKDAADKAAADPVREQLAALPDTDAVSSADADKIANARAAYDALTEDQKALVGEESLAKLTGAEKALAAVNSAKASLNEAADAAVAAGKAVHVSADGSDVPGSEMWVTTDAAKALEDAVTAARAVADDDNATGADLERAKTSLESAEAAFAAAQTPGTKPAPKPAPKPATSATYGGVTYKVAGKYAQAASAKKSIKKATVRDTVRIGGRAYKVTSVKAKAFKGCKKLKSLTIGRNVQSIGKQAFSGCKKLKTVTVKTKKLSKRGVKGSLRGSSVKTVKVKVGSKKANKKYVKKYKRILTKKAAGKKVSVK